MEMLEDYVKKIQVPSIYHVQRAVAVNKESSDGGFNKIEMLKDYFKSISGYLCYCVM